MKRIKKSWIALLLGALLMATLVGVAGARPMRQTTYKLTIPAAHFHPVEDGYAWYNRGDFITVHNGYGTFHAALPIALPGRFTVERMTLIAYDNNPNPDCYVAAYLYRVNPWTLSQELMGEVETVGASTTMQVLMTTDIGPPDTIYGAHGGYIELYISDPIELVAYAVNIYYH